MSRARTFIPAAAAALALSSLAWLVACGGAASTPTSVPTPVATPSPAPTPTLDPNVPPAGSGCGVPYPPKITRLTVKVHLKDRDFWLVDSTPLVGPDGEYCARIGFGDGRLFCPLRPEGHPERSACENWRAGVAKDTAEPGPTWTFTPKGGTPIHCTDAASGCTHVPGSPFQVHAIQGGLYRACTADDVCGEEDVDRNL